MQAKSRALSSLFQVLRLDGKCGRCLYINILIVVTQLAGGKESFWTPSRFLSNIVVKNCMVRVLNCFIRDNTKAGGIDRARELVWLTKLMAMKITAILPYGVATCRLARLSLLWQSDENKL